MIVLVLGPGRCGTSTVARLLQEKCGVFMCQQDRQQPSAHNPHGFYEDKAFGEIFKQLTKEKQNIEHWEAQLRKLIQERSMKFNRWGLKSNLLAYFLPVLLMNLPEPPRIIRCHRNLYDSAQSWARVFGDSFRDCIREVDTRIRLLDEWLGPLDHFRIDFNTKVDETEMLKEIRSYIFQDGGTDARNSK